MATEDKRIDQLDPVSVLDLTSLMAMQQGTNAKKVTLQQLLDYLNGQIDTGNAVLFVSQTLTESEKRTARKNIRAAGEGDIPYGVVHYLSDQSLTEEQQHQARKNIRCASVGEVSADCVASGNYAHAEGRQTKATENYSHTEGYGTTASNSYAHAEGRDTTASGSYAHAENANTTASGQASHAEGRYTRSDGAMSHAEGYNTHASRAYQHVEGAYNVVDDVGSSDSDKGKYVHIVGNGTAKDARSNAHTLDWDGVPWYAGDRVMLGGIGMDDEAAVALMPVFVPQELTEEQKLQARTNIGAAAIDDIPSDVVTYTEQALTEEQKAKARANIGVDAYIEQVFLGGEW